MNVNLSRMAAVLCLAWMVGCRSAPREEPAAATVDRQAPLPPSQSGAEPPPKSQWKVTASAVQEDIFPPEFACDGTTNTRWSSPPSDPQWLQIDLGRPANLCGLSILWETAFASAYSILTSPDGVKWDEVYSTQSGDGQTDDIYFRPVSARFVRILCRKRGTGWGHSIWEVCVKGLSELPIIESPGTSQTANLFDGRLATSWTSATPAPASLTIDLRKEKALGGVRLDWGKSFATDFVVFFSDDGSTWNKLGEVKKGTEGFDYVLHSQFMARYLRFDLRKGALNKPLEVEEISLRGPDEALNPLTLYQIAAEKARPGLYPDSLRKRQVYWTIVGQPGDRAESLLDEYGNLEPVANGSSIMPYVFTGGKLLSAFDASCVTQSLDSGYLPLPAVLWDLNGLKLTVEALTCGSMDDSITFARYKLSNDSQTGRNGKFFLAIRPVQVNPPWQFGGLSNITSMEYVAGSEWPAAVRVNGNELFFSLIPPAGFGACAFDQGDIMRSLVEGVLPPAQKLENAGDLISGALAYDFDLKPGADKSVVIAAPLHGKNAGVFSFRKRGNGEPYAVDAAFTKRLEEMSHTWASRLDAVKIDLPDRDIVNTMKSQLAYILINRDGVAIQPGSRNYQRTWIRDGCLTSAALLRMGITDTVRDYLDWYAERILPDGLVPPILNQDGTVNTGFGSNLEYDSQGEFVYAIMEYYRFTGDKEFLQKHFPRIQLALRYLVTLRERTLDPDYRKDEPARERFVGILPPSFSHEGYASPVHSYWDDFFALKGWKDGKEAAEILGKNEVAAWAAEQYNALRDSVKASIEKTIAFKGLDYVPGCAEKGDADASSTTISFFPCDEQDLLPAAALKKTYDTYYSNCNERLSPNWAGGFTPYEIRNITAFVDLGEKDRANFLLDYMMTCRRPPAWNHWGEVVLSDPRMGSFIGDMPHTWVGSGFVHAIRDMLIKERNGKLVLLDGTPESWVREKSGIRVENLPTYFGEVDMKARASNHQLTVTLGGGANPPKGLEIRWPIRGAPGRVAVDGYKWTDFDETSCRLPGMAREIIAEWAESRME